MAASSDDGAVSLPSFSSVYKGVASILNPPLQTVITAFSTTKHVTTGLPTPSHVNIELMSGEVYKLLTTIFEQNLLLFHYIQVTLREWKTSHPVVHFLDMEPTLFNPADFVVNGIYETHQGITLTAEATRNLRLLTWLRYPMSAFISKLVVTMNPQTALNFKKLLEDIHAFYKALVPSLLQVARSSEPNIQFKAADLPPDSNPEDAYVTEACFTILENQRNLDDFIRSLVSRHRKPRNNPNHWIWFGIQAVTVSICSIWIYRSGICSTLLNGIKGFGSSLQQSLVTFKDEWFKKSHEVESNEMESSSKLLHQLLLNFIEQSTGEKLPPDTLDEDMLKVFRSQDPTKHLIKNLFTGKLFASYIIQFQEIKVWLEWANALMKRVAKQNWFIIVTPLPRLIVSGLFLWPVLKISRACVYKLDAMLNRKQRFAKLEARHLIMEIEKRVVQLIEQKQPLDEGVHYLNGLLLYTIDRFYREVQRYAPKTYEWQRLMEAINFLLQTYTMRLYWNAEMQEMLLSNFSHLEVN